MKTASLLSVFLVLGLACSGMGQASATESGAAAKAERVKFDPKRDAAKDIENAIVRAKKENKRIMLDVGGEWCGWCHKLDEFFATNQEAGDLLRKRYVVVKVNFSPENKNEAVISRYPKINGYPHLFVLDKTGKLLHSQDTGELETGDHHDAAKVVPFLKKWAG
ncbi:MAG: thioredoxin family protein [Fimbriimonadaceae bacterium]|nr:thioredoxin family protein [Fimbriimonadaceae bacterium]